MTLEAENHTHPYVQYAHSVLDLEIQALTNARQHLSHAFVAAAQRILQAGPSGRVVVMGMGKSGHVGNKIAATLASTGTPAFFVHPAEAGHGDLGMITPQDVVLAISQSGKTDELLQLIPYFKRHGIALIAMTGDLKSPLALHADSVIHTAIEQEACPLGLAPTASTTLAMALGDALAVCLLQARGFSKEDFAITHPHGSLGRRLLVHVRDIMSTHDKLPQADPSITIRDALVIMSECGMGLIVATDAQQHPLGVFTDGDLRRCLDHGIQIHHTPLAEVMTTTFTRAHENQLAATAVELMERHKVSSLPVVDDAQRLVGAINMRQILRAGII